MSGIKTRLGEGGRVVIPSIYRKALGLKPGDELLLAIEDGEIRIITARQAIHRSQALVRYVPEGRSLSGELIRERRGEAEIA